MNQTFKTQKQDLMAASIEAMQEHLEDVEYTLPEQLALTCRILFENGHDSGLAGQITARGEEPGTFLTQRLGLGFDETAVSNLLLVNEDLEVVRGKGMANPANRFHSWVYRARPDVRCIIHSHALYTASLSMLCEPLHVAHMDNCALYDDVAFVPHWPGVPVGNEEGELISTALGSKRALMLSHHGLLVATASIQESCVIALAFERAARMHLIAQSAGRVHEVEPALGREAHDWLLRPKRTSSSFAYYARRTLRNHADCLR